MPNWCFNWLTVRGKPEDLERFKNGLKIDDRWSLLESYLPCPQKLYETKSSYLYMGYEAFFNPDPEGYIRILKLPEIKKLGIETREQLMEYVKREYPDGYEDPDSYEVGLKVNNNLFEFGYKSWYEWRIANWGTRCIVNPDGKIKHQDYDLTVVSPTELRFDFDSAWDSPRKGIDQIAALFPELEFKLEFAVPEAGFRGCGHWVNGELVDIIYRMESVPMRYRSCQSTGVIKSRQFDHSFFLGQSNDIKEVMEV